VYLGELCPSSAAHDLENTGARRQGALAPQLPRATRSPEFPPVDFCTVMCFGGFLGAFQAFLLGSSSVLDHTPVHLEKPLIFENISGSTHLCVDLCVDPPIFQK